MRFFTPNKLIFYQPLTKKQGFLNVLLNLIYNIGLYNPSLCIFNLLIYIISRAIKLLFETFKAYKPSLQEFLQEHKNLLEV